MKPEAQTVALPTHEFMPVPNFAHDICDFGYQTRNYCGQPRAAHLPAKPAIDDSCDTGNDAGGFPLAGLKGLGAPQETTPAQAGPTQEQKDAARLWLFRFRITPTDELVEGLAAREAPLRAEIECWERTDTERRARIDVLFRELSEARAEIAWLEQERTEIGKLVVWPVTDLLSGVRSVATQAVEESRARMRAERERDEAGKLGLKLCEAVLHGDQEDIGEAMRAIRAAFAADK